MNKHRVMVTDTVDAEHVDQQTMSIIQIENDKLTLAVIPKRGGKVVTLHRKKTGTQFLQEPRIDYQLLTSPKYGEAFIPPHAAGFDECFPTISRTTYRHQDQELELPDHGELWSKAWKYRQYKNGISLWTYGEQLDYRFAKHIELDGPSVHITYELESMEMVPFDYIWSAHPLLSIAEGDELLLSDDMDEVVLNWASDPQIGTFGETLQWPKILGNNSNIDFNDVQDKELGLAVKLFSNKLNNGRAGLYKKHSDESLLFTFNTEQVPYLGLWLCYGGWPADGHKKDYTLALEPCSARPDDLAKACEREEQQKIAPGCIKCWQCSIDVADGKVNIQ